IKATYYPDVGMEQLVPDQFWIKAVCKYDIAAKDHEDKSRDAYKILDEERRCQKQGVHVRYPKTAKDMTYLPESRELCWWTDLRRRLLVTEENRMKGSLSYMLL
ncbi:hypothetical protein Tco_0100614, partial [Tanacetum coccineum]